MNTAGYPRRCGRIDLITLSLLALAFAGAQAWAADRYVNGACTIQGDGSSPSCATTANGPGAYRSPQDCVVNMNAQETCYVRAGTYTRDPGGDYSKPGFDFCTRDISGTASKYTTIAGYPGDAKPKFCSDSSCSVNPNAAAIGVVKDASRTCQYIKFDGIEVQGSLAIRGGYGTTPTAGPKYIWVANSDLHGGWDSDGNYNMLWVESATHVQIDHNYFHGMDSGGGNNQQSTTGIKTWDVQESVYEYNTFYWNDGAVLAKHDVDEKENPGHNIIRYNRGGTSAYSAVRLNGQAGVGAPSGDEVYGNLFVGSGATIEIGGGQNGALIHHNTLIGASGNSCLQVAALNTTTHTTSATIRDNICQPSGQYNFEYLYDDMWADRTGWTIDYQRYRAGGQYRHSGFTGALSAWQTELGSGKEAHSTEVASPVCAWTNTADYGIASGACLTGSSSGGRLGYEGATSCAGYLCGQASGGATCGNGVKETGETCDGTALGGATCSSQGFASGTLKCSADCKSFDTSSCVAAPICGNNVKETGETCDGTDLGGATCSSQGFASGTLKCSSDCKSLDTSSCTAAANVADECASPRSEWLLCDGFESGSLSYWSADLNNDGGNLTTSTSSPFSGSNFGRQNHVTGGTGGWGTHFFADHPLLATPGAMVSDLYLRSMVRFSAGYSWPTVGDKIFIIAAFESWSANYVGPNSWSPYYVTLYADASGRPALELHRKITTDTWRQLPQNVGTPVTFSTGKWHEVQVHVRLNTPGSADGVVEMWVDGAKTTSYADVDVRSTYTAHGFNHLILSPYANPSSPANQQQDWDAVIASTAMIPSPATVPPPENVRRNDVH